MSLSEFGLVRMQACGGRAAVTASAGWCPGADVREGASGVTRHRFCTHSMNVDIGREREHMSSIMKQFWPLGPPERILEFPGSQLGEPLVYSLPTQSAILE